LCREPRARRPCAHRGERARFSARRLCHEGRAEEGQVRALFLLLVLANVGFFAWARYVSPPDAAADPLPLTRQIDPEKVKIVTPNEIPPAASAPAATPAPRTPTASAAPAAATPAATPAVLKCIEWGSFTIADAPRAE